MNALKQNADLILGSIGEDKCLPLFQEKIDKQLAKTNTYSYVDFISPNTYVEIKTRRCNHNTYADTMIGKNKVEFCLKSKRNCYLAWNFQDGIYFWKVNQKDLDDGNVYYAMGGRTDRGVDERKECAYIKREVLQELNKL
jgi:hypothetical protein